MNNLGPAKPLPPKVQDYLTWRVYLKISLQHLEEIILENLTMQSPKGWSHWTSAICSLYMPFDITRSHRSFTLRDSSSPNGTNPSILEDVTNFLGNQAFVTREDTLKFTDTLRSLKTFRMSHAVHFEQNIVKTPFTTTLMDLFKLASHSLNFVTDFIISNNTFNLGNPIIPDQNIGQELPLGIEARDLQVGLRGHPTPFNDRHAQKRYFSLKLLPAKSISMSLHLPQKFSDEQASDLLKGSALYSAEEGSKCSLGDSGILVWKLTAALCYENAREFCTTLVKNNNSRTVRNSIAAHAGGNDLAIQWGIKNGALTAQDPPQLLKLNLTVIRGNLA